MNPVITAAIILGLGTIFAAAAALVLGLIAAGRLLWDVAGRRLDRRGGAQ